MRGNDDVLCLLPGKPPWLAREGSMEVLNRGLRKCRTANLTRHDFGKDVIEDLVDCDNRPSRLVSQFKHHLSTSQAPKISPTTFPPSSHQKPK